MSSSSLYQDLLSFVTDALKHDSTSLSTSSFPLSIPLGPAPHINTFVSHLTSTTLHPTYYPYLRFGALHAARVTLVWELMKRARKVKGGAKSVQGQGGVGVMGDLFGYLTIAWGGSTLVNILLSQPPNWLISTAPWATYIPIYLLLVPTGMSSFFISSCPSFLLSTLGACIDGTTRGVTIASIPPAIIASSSIPAAGTWWTSTILPVIAICGGGFVAQLFGLDTSGATGNWTMGTPNVLRGGILNTLDAWGAGLAAILYVSLLGSYEALQPLTRTLARALPDEVILPGARLLGTKGVGPLVDTDTARAITILFLASLFLARALSLALLSPGKAQAASRFAPKLDKAEKEVLEAVTHEKAESVVAKASGRQTTPGGGGQAKKRAGTPKKSG